MCCIFAFWFISVGIWACVRSESDLFRFFFLDWRSNVLSYFRSDCTHLKVNDVRLNIDACYTLQVAVEKDI